MTIAGLIVAAGRGTRAAARDNTSHHTKSAAPTTGTASLPKQYRQIGGRLILARTMEVFLKHPSIAHILVVIHPDDAAAYQDCLSGLTKAGIALDGLLPPTQGAASRQASVLAGLEALRSADLQNVVDAVMIHDAARPFVDNTIIDRVAAELQECPGAIAAEPLADTLKRANPDNMIAGTIDRSGLWRAQTPQGFKLDEIHKAHIGARDAGKTDFTDDAALAEWAGMPVKLVEGSPDNEKLTTVQEIEMADQRLTAAASLKEFRTGTGYDVHRFAEGDHVWLGGLKIPHTHRLDGHSDADVGLHALTDALLGAIADGDIGTHFPPSDPTWKGARSDHFLADAARRITERNGQIVSVDLTIICEEPKIGPHRDAMRDAIAAILKIETNRVSIKATTSEQLGFTGRREGIAAMASATVSLPLAASH